MLALTSISLLFSQLSFKLFPFNDDHPKHTISRNILRRGIIISTFHFWFIHKSMTLVQFFKTPKPTMRFFSICLMTMTQERYICLPRYFRDKVQNRQDQKRGHSTSCPKTSMVFYKFMRQVVNSGKKWQELSGPGIIQRQAPPLPAPTQSL